VLVLIFVQLLAGALVAGLDAGMGFNTWPLINGALVPSGLGAAESWYLNLFENPLAVQFNHRMLGYAVVAATLLQLAWLGMKRAAPPLIGSALTLALLALLQATIGVWTLLLAVPIELGVAHQAGAVAVFVASLYHYWLAGHPEAVPARAQAAASA
jgi:cytochrome c oxidase assembly protein subunit 15